MVDATRIERATSTIPLLLGNQSVAHDAAAVFRVFGQYCKELGLVTPPAN